MIASVLEYLPHFATVISRWASVARSVPSKYNKKCTYASKTSIFFENNRFYLSSYPTKYLVLGASERVAGNLYIQVVLPQAPAPRCLYVG